MPRVGMGRSEGAGPRRCWRPRGNTPGSASSMAMLVGATSPPARSCSCPVGLGASNTELAPPTLEPGTSIVRSPKSARRPEHSAVFCGIEQTPYFEVKFKYSIF